MRRTWSPSVSGHIGLFQVNQMWFQVARVRLNFARCKIVVMSSTGWLQSGVSCLCGDAGLLYSLLLLFVVGVNVFLTCRLLGSYHVNAITFVSRGHRARKIFLPALIVMRRTWLLSPSGENDFFSSLFLFGLIKRRLWFCLCLTISL